MATPNSTPPLKRDRDLMAELEASTAAVEKHVALLRTIRAEVMKLNATIKHREELYEGVDFFGMVHDCLRDARKVAKASGEIQAQMSKGKIPTSVRDPPGKDTNAKRERPQSGEHTRSKRRAREDSEDDVLLGRSPTKRTRVSRWDVRPTVKEVLDTKFIEDGASEAVKLKRFADFQEIISRAIPESDLGKENAQSSETERGGTPPLREKRKASMQEEDNTDHYAVIEVSPKRVRIGSESVTPPNPSRGVKRGWTRGGGQSIRWEENDGSVRETKRYRVSITSRV